MLAEPLTPSAEEADASAERVVGAIARAMKNVSFYDLTHPVVKQVLAEALAGLSRHLDGRPEFVLKFTNGYVVVQDTPVLSQNVSIGNLVGACRRRGADTIVCRRGVDEDELSHLVEVLAMEPGDVEAAGGMGQALLARGVRHIAVQRVVSQPGDDEVDDPGSWRWMYSTALDVLRGAASELRTGRPIDIESVQSSVREIVDDIMADRSIVYNLNWMKGMDEYTFVHALHICLLGIELGRDVALPREQLEQLATATLLHDVGKVFVPLEILRKPAKLAPSEFTIMRRHPVDGALVLAREGKLPTEAAVVAFEHHIHMDYSGYPKMRRRRPLNMYSLMTSIADVYDALTTMRPYRPPLPPHTAISVMREEYAGRLEPRLLERFIAMLGPHPWGTLLQLSNDRLAVVTRPNPEAPDNPLTRTIDVEGGIPVVSQEEAPLLAVTGGRNDVPIVDPVAIGLDLTALLHREVVGTPPEADRKG